MTNLRAFDLAAAEAGEMPVTRDGKKKAIFVRHFPNPEWRDRVRVVFDNGEAAWYCDNGQYYCDTDSSLDLFLPAKSVELWQNLYRSAEGTYYSCSHVSRESADRNKEPHRIGPALRVEFPL